MNYIINQTWKGFEISKKNEYGRSFYLKSIYKGQAIWSRDYLYAKHYKTETGAKKAIDRIES